MRAIDLHTHTAKSDGSYTPTELVDYAIEKNLAAVAVTDHDSIEGLDEALSHAASLMERGLPSVEVVPGIEFSTKYEKQDVHVVGLFIAYDSPVFRNALTGFVDSRINRNKKMCENLRGA
ncbi:MAG: PHP domain-containing protein, partial [Bacteroidales bacterium]|nr:PHP domain-containing protein [Bacteroidales bacterium]